MARNLKYNNPNKYKAPPNVRELARAYTKEAIRTLAAIMRTPQFPPASRVRAAVALLDRGWGCPSQTHQVAIEDNTTLLKVVNEIVHVHRDPEDMIEQVEDYEPPLLELSAIRHNGNGQDNNQNH